METVQGFTTIVSTAVLAEHLDDPAWIVFDCRFDLQKPDWGLQDYLMGHIPGAIYADLDRDLSGPRTPAAGRHPLPSPDRWMDLLSSWGMTPDKQVIVYDTAGGAYAARMWWMLRWVGHDRVAVLDGGYPKWVREGRPVSAGRETRVPAQFSGNVRPAMLADADEVDRLREDPRYRLIDARSGVRFRGEQEPIDPVAGHIPGAVNRFHGDNLAPEGTFLPTGVLRSQFETLLDGAAAERAVVYCGSGVTSCHHLIAMELAGLPGARLYAGSWSEWIRDPSRARAVG